MRQPPLFFAALALLHLGLLAGGCASVHYEVAGPGAPRGEVPRNAGQIFSRDKVDYEFFQLEQMLVVRFVNRTGQPMRLTAESVMIDNAGRPFALEAQEVLPDQSGRLVLPPMNAAPADRAPPVATEVHVGAIDEGGVIGSRRDLENSAAGNAGGATAAPAPTFRWPNGQRVRLRLIYRLGEKDTLTHDWTLRRSR